MDFPDYQWWRRNVVLEGDKRFFKKHYYDYYFEKYLIANAFCPMAIAEIGVRWGYSAYSFLRAAPRADYTGFDIINGGHGGAKQDTFARVHLMLSQHFPCAGITLKHADTQKLNSLGDTYDFVHVDGDHTEAGCLHDIKLAFEACVGGGVVLVDDYTNIDGVKRAADKFVKDNDNNIKQCHLIPSVTGEFLIIKG